jgi:hypothetical protein
MAKAVRLEVKGYMRLDPSGQIVFDQCPSDPLHLQSPTTTDGERSTCRQVLSHQIPAAWVGKKGSWTLTITFQEEP